MESSFAPGFTGVSEALRSAAVPGEGFNRHHALTTESGGRRNAGNSGVAGVSTGEVKRPFIEESRCDWLSRKAKAQEATRPLRRPSFVGEI